MKRLNVNFVNFRVLMLLLALITLSLTPGCKDNQLTESTSPITTADNADISVMSSNTSGDAGLLVFDYVKIMIKDIKLDVEGNSHEENFKTGPFVVNLNLNSSVNVFSTSMIPEGRYDRVKFEIHKLGPNETPPDPDFGTGSSRYSVVAAGTYNGVPFTYHSKQSVNQTLNFGRGVGIVNGIKTNITLSIDPYAWFYDNGHFLDPALERNENDIDRNIRNSFRAFCDNDRNGVPDDH